MQHVDFPGHEGIGTRRGIEDRPHFAGIEEGPVVPEEVLEALELGGNTGNEFFQPVGSRAALAPVDLAFAIGRQDHEVIVGHDVGEVGIAAGEVEDHVVAVGGDLVDAGEQRLAAGLRALAPVMIDGGHNVTGGKRLAVVEFDTLAQLEHPALGTGFGLP